MLYTKPGILNSVKAISFTRQIFSTASATYKFCDAYYDSAVPFPVCCTFSAYAADE